ncbi:hypothetical protein SCG7109_AK_00280 [Chlamydiales bacterium SCGC AG-110-M15]|nr:hypothetical protein SCG7109_AK_00280 [Chlamydiales bacterium SCGC AG-110-M15]
MTTPLPQRLLKATKQSPKSCFVGFDGFTDEIISVVDKRMGTDVATLIPTINSLSSRLAAAAGHSCNLELLINQKKLGGNAPILANALLEAGHHITFSGTIGHPEAIEELFLDISSRCDRVIPLGPSAHSDALEFEDGKVILGKLEALMDIDYEHLITCISEEELTQALDKCALFASVNWTMLPHMTSIWHSLCQHIFPRLKVRSKKPFFFVDFADPAKRTDNDLDEAIKALQDIESFFDVVLGLNIAEAQRFCDVCGISSSDSTLALSQTLHSHLSLSQVLIHDRADAAVSSKDGTTEVLAELCLKPKLSTGAGDNFNAGYCTGLLFDFSCEDALLLAMATGGYYIREGKSPSMEDLSKYLSEHPIRVC